MHDRFNDELLEFDDFPLIEGNELYVRKQGANMKTFEESSFASRIMKQIKRYFISSTFGVLVLGITAIGAVFVLIKFGAFVAPEDKKLQESSVQHAALLLGNSTINNTAISNGSEPFFRDSVDNCLKPINIFGNVPATMMKKFEPSDCAFSKSDSLFYVVSDTGKLAAVDKEGKVVSKFKIGKKYDLEAIATVEDRPGFVYIGVERPPMIIEFNVEEQRKSRVWDLQETLTNHTNIPDGNSGLESLIYLPRLSDGKRGYFYAGMQSNGHILVLDLHLEDPSKQFSTIGFLQLPSLAPQTDLAAMTVSNNSVYFLFDLPQKVVRVPIHLVQEATQELVKKLPLAVTKVSVAHNSSDAIISNISLESNTSTLNVSLASNASNITLSINSANISLVSNASSINNTNISLVSNASNSSISNLNVSDAYVVTNSSNLNASSSQEIANSSVANVDSRNNTVQIENKNATEMVQNTTSNVTAMSTSAVTVTRTVVNNATEAVNVTVEANLTDTESTNKTLEKLLRRGLTTDSESSETEVKILINSTIKAEVITYELPVVVLDSSMLHGIYSLPRQGYEGMCFNTTEVDSGTTSATLLLTIDGKGKGNVGLEFSTIGNLATCSE